VSPALDHRLLNTAKGLDAANVGPLLAMAQELRSMQEGGTMSGLLKGVNIALVCDQPGAAEDAFVFEHAATRLGARVARIRSSDAGLAATADIGATARLLGRLYDAVECQGVDAQVIAQLTTHSGIVVYDAIGSATHPLFLRLHALMHDAHADDHGCREAVIQAILLSTLR
jgi:ornithine carbamoyltransferase